MPTRRPPATGAPPSSTVRNEVVLVGRLAAAAQLRELPSGDEIVSFRLIVPRAAQERARADGPARQVVDTIDCTAWTPALRRRLLGCAEGEHLEVSGALRRRFWGGAGARTSTYGVEVTSLRRLSRPSPGSSERAGSRARAGAGEEPSR